MPKVGGWIPVSNKLPERGKSVLCTEKNTGLIYVGYVDYFNSGACIWFDDRGFSMDVIAWMYLPEPYKEEVT